MQNTNHLVDSNRRFDFYTITIPIRYVGLHRTQVKVDGFWSTLILWECNSSSKATNLETEIHRHKTDRNPSITNQKPWSIDWQLENTYSSFLRGQLWICKGQFRFWLTSQKTPNSKLITFLTSPVSCYPKQLVAFQSKVRKRVNETSVPPTTLSDIIFLYFMFSQKACLLFFWLIWKKKGLFFPLEENASWYFH